MSNSKKIRKTSRKEIEFKDADEPKGEKELANQISQKDGENEIAEQSEKKIAKATKKARKEKRRLERLRKKEDHNDLNSESVHSNSVNFEKIYGVKELKSIKSIDKHRTRTLNSEKMDIENEKEHHQELFTFIASEVKKSKGYIQNDDLTALSQDTVDTFIADNFISVTDPLSTSPSLRPILEFSFLPITDSTLTAHFKNFKIPTAIQAASWPFLFAGRDVIGIAETGSGKTMAFALPCVRRMLSPSKKRDKGARAVIVSPTRELAMQSYEQIIQLCKTSGIITVCVYGGVPKDEQRRVLKTADIIVATPGRLNDLISEGYADLSRVEYVVLDEADRMLDKGFEQEIRRIINTTPEVGKRQTLMFTATWPGSIQSLASSFMKTPVKIHIGDSRNGDLRANNRIVQKVEVIEPRNKEYRLLQILKEHRSGSRRDDRIIVFALYKKEATRVEGFIRSKGFKVAGIHGDLSQEQRTRSLEAFKKGNTPTLVATDVAARGLDIPSVKLVVSY